MPRNEAKPLDSHGYVVQNVMRRRIMSVRTGEKVTVAYTKRSGQQSSSTGTIGEFSGKPGFDTGSVTIHTEDKGPRTINLHRIIRISQ